MSQRTQDRRWVIHLEVDEYGNADLRQFEADVLAAQAEVAGILLRLGGAVQSYAVRRQDTAGQWYTDQVVYKWSSFVPGIRAPRPAPEPELGEEPELDVELEDDEPVAEDAPVVS